MAISHMGRAADMPCSFCYQKNLIRTCEDCCLMQISNPHGPVSCSQEKTKGHSLSPGLPSKTASC